MAKRVWDRYLTERDQAHLAMRPPRRHGFGEHPALLLIDLYRWVFGDKPELILEAMKNWPGSCGLEGWDAVPSIQKLLAKAREVGIPVVHTTGLDGAGVAPRSRRRETELHADKDPEAQERLRRRYAGELELLPAGYRDREVRLDLLDLVVPKRQGGAAADDGGEQDISVGDESHAYSSARIQSL